jgi:transposase
MISVSSGLKVLIATKPVDFRKGMDGLAALVKAHLGADPVEIRKIAQLASMYEWQ